MGLPRSISEGILKYFDMIESMAKSFKRAINSLNDMDLNNAYKHLDECIKLDTKADAFRRELMAKIASEVKDEDLKEDLSKLLRMLDRMSEWIKEASRHLDIIPYLEIPVEIREKIERLSYLDKRAAEELSEAAKALLEGDRKEMGRRVEEVERIEEEADEVNHVAKKTLVSLGYKITNPAVIVMLRDFIEALETATDYAEDVADIIKILSLRSITVEPLSNHEVGE